MSHKLPKVNESLRNILGQAIGEEFGMQYGLVSVTKVDVSPDIKSARVFISCFNCADSADFIKKLNTHASEYQRLINEQIRLKYTPKLKFILDDTIEYADRIEKLLKQ